MQEVSRSVRVQLRGSGEVMGGHGRSWSDTAAQRVTPEWIRAQQPPWTLLVKFNDMFFRVKPWSLSCHLINLLLDLNTIMHLQFVCKDNDKYIKLYHRQHVAHVCFLTKYRTFCVIKVMIADCTFMGVVLPV